jgi:hypothetical protein
MLRDAAPSAVEPVAGDLPRDERRRLVLRRPKVEKPPPSRVKGEGWRSVISGAVVAVILGGLAAWTSIPAERIEAVAPWLTLSLMAVIAGKDIGRIADSVVAAARALRGA